MTDDDDNDLETEAHPDRQATTPAQGLAVLGGDAGFSLARLLRGCGLAVADGEPAPRGISAPLAARFCYGLGAVRAGALGELRVLAQLVDQARTLALPEAGFWAQPDGTWVDGLRPGVDPAGLADLAQAQAYRRAHLHALAGVLGGADTLVVPLSRITAWQDGTSGLWFPAPPDGVHPPKSLRPHRATAAELEHAFGALHGALIALNPKARLVLVLAPGAEAGAQEMLQDRIAAWAARCAGVQHDPVLDALIARAAALPEGHADGPRLGAVLARLVAGEDLLDIVAAGPAPLPAAPERRSKDPARKQRRKDKKAREAAKAAGGAMGGATGGKTEGGTSAPRSGKVMCEDELLEAFSK